MPENLETKVKELEESIERITGYMHALQQALGVELVPSKNGSFNLKILSPKKGEYLGVIAHNYWAVKDLVKNRKIVT